MATEKKQKNLSSDKSPIRIAIPLEGIVLDQKQTREVLAEATAGAVASFVPGIGTLFDWVNRRERLEYEKKVTQFLLKVREKFEDIEDAIFKLTELTQNPKGQTLFCKIIQILKNGVADEEWIALLANTIRGIANSSIEDQFENNSYIITQIDKIGPHSLILLSKFDIWKKATIQNTTTTSEQTLSGDWDIQAAGYFARSLGITDSKTILRIQHTFRNLENDGMIKLTGQTISTTATGYDVYKIITTS